MIETRKLPPAWISQALRLCNRWKLEAFLVVYVLFFFVWPFVYEEPAPTVTRTIHIEAPFAPTEYLR